MKIIKWIVRKSWLLAAAAIILLALSLGVARLATPLLSHYQQPIAEWLSHELRVPVTIGKIEASWYGLQPSVKVQDLIIHDRKSRKPVFSIETAYLGISLSKSVLHRQLVLGQLMIDGAKLTVQYTDGHWYVSGLEEEAVADDRLRVTVRQVIGWFFVQRRLEVKNVDINLMMPSGKRVSLQKFQAVFLKNDSKKYRIRGSMNVGNKSGSKLEFALNASGEIENPENTRARFYVGAKRVELQPWITYFNQYGFSIDRGNLDDVKIQGRYKDGKIYQLQSNYQLSNLKSTNEKAPTVNQLKGNVAFQASNTADWDLAIDIENIKVNQKIWPKNWLSIRKTSDQLAEHAQYSLYLHYAKFSPMLAILKNMQHHDPYMLLRKIEDLSGTANDIYVAVPDDFLESQRFSLGAKFKDVSWKIAGWPEISNLSGNVAADRTSGELTVTGENSRIYFPKIFSEPLLINRLETMISWQHQKDGWQLKAPNLLIEDDVSNIVGNVSIDLPSNSVPTVELIAGLQVSAFNSADLSKRMPVKIMSPKVVDWLNQSILGVKSLNSTLVLRGDLSQFPFHNSPGTFIVQSQFEDIDLSYLQSWPKATGLNGYLRFEEAGMEALIHSGQLSGAEIIKAKVTIPDFFAAPANLLISGYAKGSMAQGLQFISTSPLGQSLGKILQPIQPEGDLDLKLELEVPLKANLAAADVSVKGMVDLQNNQLTLRKWQDLTLKNLQGELQFDRTSITAKNVAANLWGNPLAISMETKPQQLQLNISSQLSAENFNQLLGLPEEKWFNGQANLSAELDINAKGKHVLRVVTDLNGLASNLPQPLQKSADKLWPSSLSMMFDNENIDIKLLLGKVISSQIHAPIAEGWAGVQGQIALGKLTSPLEHAGIWLTGSLDHWHWQQWQPLLLALNWDMFKSQDTSNKLLFGIDVTVDDLELFGLDLPKTQVIAKPKTEFWQLDFNGTNIFGRVDLPGDLNNKVIKIELDKLVMMPTEGEKSPAKLQPNQFPNVQMMVKDTWLKDMPLGRFNLQVSRQAQGAAIDRLEFATPWLHFISHGLWHLDNGKSITEFSGQLTSTNLSRMLSQWHMPKHLHGNKSKFSFNLKWPGTPADISLKEASGLVKVNVKSGYFSGLSKETDKKIGLGNLLSLLSFHSITQRLQLNFKDITHKGYHFDVLKGNFKLDKGDATTRKLRLVGNIADITIKGRIGLIKENYNLEVVVVPHLTASLPVIATLAGGPVVGAVAWLLDKAVGSEVNRMTRYEYLVSGPWQNPTVQPVRSPMRHVTKKKNNNIILSKKVLQ